MLKVKSHITVKRNDGTAADTYSLTIPARLAQDSAFGFKKGDTVWMEYLPEKKIMVVTAYLEEENKPAPNPNE